MRKTAESGYTPILLATSATVDPSGTVIFETEPLISTVMRTPHRYDLGIYVLRTTVDFLDQKAISLARCAWVLEEEIEA
jgi:hypothetical protein